MIREEHTHLFELCEDCMGKGYYVKQRKCKECKGTGWRGAMMAIYVFEMYLQEALGEDYSYGFIEED